MPGPARQYTSHMNLEYLKRTTAAVWILGFVILGAVLSIASPVGWALFTVVAIGPPLVMLHFWNKPAQTLSQSIQEAR